MSFRTSLSGLDAASTDLSVIGNNIANASTNGFKESRAEFVDVFATTFSGVSSSTPGSGVRVASVSQQFAQGNVEFTSSNLDLAINGEGLFILDDDGSSAYTRAGAFSTDRDGYVVDSSGRQLQVFSPNDNGTFNTGSLTSLQLVTSDALPQTTSNITAVLNLDATQAKPDTPTFSKDIADSFNHSTSTTVFDSLGNGFPATMYYVASDPTANEWQVHTYVNDEKITPVGLGLDVNNVQLGSNDEDKFFTINFNSLGTFDDITPNGITPGTLSDNPRISFLGLDMGNDSVEIELTFDYGDTTQFGGDFAVNSLSQDGFASGRLSGLDIDQTGVVFARFTNGQSTQLGAIALASFPNSQGLRQLGGTSWAETFASGDRVLGAPGTAGLGGIQSGALEASNVDIAKQLVSLITSQRNFQANAQAITTQNEIQQAIINIR